MSTERKEIADEVFHGIPGDEKLKFMSFSDLAIELAGCEKGSPKFLVIEREMKKFLAEDQAKINLKNILIGAWIGLLGVVLGAFLGAYLKNPCDAQKSNPNVMNQIEKNQLTVKPPIGDAPTLQPPSIPVSIKPAPSQNNGQH